MEGATITLDNGAGDVVKFGLGFPGFAVDSTITLGNGNNDLVDLDTFTAISGTSGSTISLGNGNNDGVMAFTRW